MKARIGRIVEFWQNRNSEPCAAIVTAVHTDNKVNLCVFLGNGHTMAKANITLLTPGSSPPTHEYCTWPATTEGETATSELQATA